MKERSLYETLKIMGKLLSQIKNCPDTSNADVSVRFSAEVYDSDEDSYEYAITLVIDLQSLVEPIEYKTVETIKKIAEDMGFSISRIDSSENSILLYLYYELGKDFL